MNKEALATRLQAAFLEDLDEQLSAMNESLLVLEERPTDPEALARIFRAAHTLKGASRATGIPYVEPACHALEDMLGAVRDGRQALQPADFATLFFAADALADTGARLRAGQSLDAAPITQVEARVVSGAVVDPGISSTSSSSPDDASSTSPDAPVPAPPMRETSPPSTVSATTLPTAPTGPTAGSMRVQSEKIDSLMTAGSQLAVSRSRLRSRTQQASELSDFVRRWSAQWRTVGPNVRQTLQRDSRDSELVSLLDTFEHNLRHVSTGADAIAEGIGSDADTFDGMIGKMFDNVQSVRMRPFADACEPLARAVRDVATEVGKTATLVVSGGDVEADRAVLDILREALLHLVRNAVDHGLETPAERIAHGKPEVGTVSVSASLGGDRMIVTVSDDGAGVDRDRLRATLERRGIAVPSTDEELLRTLFLSGLSTRTGVTAISGRGVGLDVVDAAVRRVGGRVHVMSELGQGTTFIMECPLTLAVIRALLVSASGHVVAIPTTYVAQLVRAQPEDMRRAEGRDVLLLDGDTPIPIVSLARLLGPPLVEKPVTGAVSLAVMRGLEGRVALAVDTMIDEDECVVRHLARVGDSVPLLSGAAILASGEIAFVLNVADAIPAALAVSGAGRLVADPSGSARKSVLVVDDSITTRTLEQSMLEGAGYEVTTAVDGADAWHLLRERTFDAVVSDVEMPRMDGFTLCETIRASAAHRQIPLILVTSLEQPAERMRGMDVGANAYIGKSSFDQATLIDTLRQLIG